MSFRLQLFAATFFLISSVFGIDEQRIASRAKIITDKFTEEHLNPRSLNDDYGKSVHRWVMDLLDPEKLLFTSEDVAEFERLALTIDNDIPQNKLTYLLAVEQRMQQRLGELDGVVTAFFAEPVPLNSTLKRPRSDFDHFPANKDQKELFRQVIHYAVIDRMLRELPDDATAFPKDSLAIMEQNARKEIQETYQRSFRRLKEDGSLLEEIYLNALTLSFDPHSSYFSPSDKQSFEQELSPDRELYGFNMRKDAENRIVISTIIPGSPAWLSNELHEGDVVEKIRWEKGAEVRVGSEGKTLEELNVLFRESLATTVHLTIVDESGKERVVTLAKGKVYSDSDVIKNAVLDGPHKIGYITLPDFYVNWTDTSSLGCANDLAKCLLKLKKENIEGLILDLRGNGGGSLREAVDLAGIFIDYGPVVAMTDKTGEVKVLRDFNRGAIYTGPFIVLIDEGSASASEVVAGVLQDYNKALIVGRQSFGKATSQVIQPLDPSYNAITSRFEQENPDYGYVNITTGGLYRVTRKWNQKCGVTPDIVLPFDYGSDRPESERDYPNALEPDSISKKITFTPGQPLPKEELKQKAEQRAQTDGQLKAYSALLNELKLFEEKDVLVHFNLEEALRLRNERNALYAKVEQFDEQLRWSYKAVPNQFDSEVYEANSLLRGYNDRFLKSLSLDMELIETVNILSDLIEYSK